MQSIHLIDGPHFHQRKHRTLQATTLANAACVGGLIIWSIVHKQMSFGQFLAVVALALAGLLYLWFWIRLEQRIMRRGKYDFAGTIVSRLAPTKQVVGITGQSPLIKNILYSGHGIIVVRMSDGSVVTLAVSKYIFDFLQGKDVFDPVRAAVLDTDARWRARYTRRTGQALPSANVA